MSPGSLRSRLRAACTAAAVVLPVFAVGVAAQPTIAAAAGGTRLISSTGTAVFTATPTGSDVMQNPEIFAQGGDAGAAPFTGTITDRARSGNGGGQGGNGSNDGQDNPTLVTSFDGLNHRQNRLANNGNQFSLEPPDQGLCVGNGFVVETINDVTRVFNTGGVPVTGVTDLNTFFHYPPAIVRGTPPTPNVFGPFVTDPSCLFDAATQRWFMDILTLDVFPANGAFKGTNHLDLAVSQTSDPTGAWTLYSLPVQDDGTQGTPNHGCSAGKPRTPPTNPNACLGDYPHIGADANGFYMTTNEYSFFGPEFHGAQLYAFSKEQLTSGAATVSVTQFDTHGLDRGNSGFTLWPATSPSGGQGAQGDQGQRSGGVEYFLSSNAASEAHGNGTGPATTSRDLLTWALTNTRSLNGSSPDLALSNTVSQIGLYAVPPLSDQKAGSTPLVDCLNDPTCATNILLGAPDRFKESETKIDSNDTRMQQVTFANGLLWGALDTALTLGGVNKAGIEWFAVSPSIDGGQVKSHVVRSGYLGLANNNLTYPAIGMTADGQGVMAFTVLGADHFPSAGFAGISVGKGTGPVTIAAEGLGPDDGFSGTFAFNAPNRPRPRWGDYGAAVPVGNNVWIASEYIGQTCTLAQYLTPPIGSCGGTRTLLANWDTRISLVRPGQ